MVASPANSCANPARWCVCRYLLIRWHCRQPFQPKLLRLIVLGYYIEYSTTTSLMVRNERLHWSEVLSNTRTHLSIQEMDERRRKIHEQELTLLRVCVIRFMCLSLYWTQTHYVHVSICQIDKQIRRCWNWTKSVVGDTTRALKKSTHTYAYAVGSGSQWQAAHVDSLTLFRPNQIQ